MTKVLTDEQNYYDIADAIRSKLDVETLYLPSEMAAAIETIETGTELTSEDEGKVVVEDAGSYVLAEQTSQTITQNGTYDTTTINELIANISGGGGGGSTNILSGDTIPTSGVGSDGNIYLYVTGNVSIVQTYNITDVSMSVTDGALTILGTTAATDSSDGVQSGVLIDTNINNVNIRVTPYQGGLQDGVCYSDGVLPTIVTRGTRRKSYDSSSAGHAFSKDDADYYFACAYNNGIGNQVRIDVVPTNPYQQFIIGGTAIYAVYLKVDGSWVPIIGQDIDDVDTGSDSTVLIPKTITENGTYDPADDQADGYSEVVVNVSHGSGNISEIEPYVFDMHRGYVSLGKFYYEAPSNSYCDVYQVEQNTDYFILLDDIVGSRFRGMLSDFDTSTTTSNINGTSTWTDKSDPKAYEIFSFNSGTNSYLTVGKDSANTSGIKTHLFKIDDLFT